MESNFPKRTTAAQVPDETLAEQTMQLTELVAQVKALEAASKRKHSAPKPRRPLSWSAALVAIVLTVCLLAAFLGWLWLTTR